MPTITFGTQTFALEIAASDVARQIGLMWRDSLDPESGMLFVFERDDYHSFWMKNTLIPLDLVWLDQSFQVVDIQTAQPCPLDETDCPSYRPSAPARYVLEVNAGTFAAQRGDQGQLSQPLP